MTEAAAPYDAGQPMLPLTRNSDHAWWISYLDTKPQDGEIIVMWFLDAKGNVVGPMVTPYEAANREGPDAIMMRPLVWQPCDPPSAAQLSQAINRELMLREQEAQNG